MDALRTTAAVAAAVVAWHNRHPLARRITPQQVHGIGVVELPLALPSQPRQRGAQILFAAQTLYHAAPARLAAWLNRHAKVPCPAPDDWPRRPLDVEPSLAMQAQQAGLTTHVTVSVLTAAVDVDGKRLRLLLAGGKRLRIHGSRAIGMPRIGAAALAAAGAGAVAVWGLMPTPHMPASPALPDGVLATIAVPADPAPSAVSAPTVQAAELPEAHPHEAAPEPALAQAEAAVPSASAAAPVELAQAEPAPPDVPVTTGPVRRIAPAIDAAARDAARTQSRALRAATAASAASAPAVHERADLIKGTVYAIATRPTAKRDAAMSQLALMRGLLAQTRTEVPTRLDLMPAGRQWRVVWWPHPSRDSANKLLADVDARGLNAELIAF